MLYLLLYLSLTGWGLAGARATRNTAYGPLWGQSTLAVLVYLFALAGALLPGALALCGLGMAYLAWAALYRQGWRLPELRFVPAASAVMFGLAVWHSRGMQFFSWDEFSHWGLQIKLLLATHTLQTNGLDLIFPDYIPGLSLYRYLGGLADPAFEQGASLISWYLAYSCILAAGSGLAGSGLGNTGMAANTTQPRWGRAAAVWAICFFGYYFFFQSLVVAMYVDAPLGLLLLAGFVVMPQAWHSRHPILYAAPLLAFIVLTKHVGIVLACMAIGLGAVAACTQAGRLRARDVKLGAALLGICLLFAASWKLYVAIHELQPAYQLAMHSLLSDGRQLWAILADNIMGVLQNHFPHALLVGGLQSPLPPGLQHLWVIVALSGAIAVLMLLAGAPAQRRQMLWLCAYLLLCLLAYLGFLAVVRAASPWEGDRWSFARYYSTLLFAALLFLAIQFIKRQRSAVGTWVIATGFAALCIAVTPGIQALFRTEPWPQPAVRAEADRLAVEVAGTIPPGAVAWYIYRVDDGFRYFITRYTLLPVRLLSRWEGSRFFWAEALQAPMTEHNAPEAFAERLKLAEYLIVDHPDPEFWARYGALFPNRNHRVYKVTLSSDGAVRLIGM